MDDSLVLALRSAATGAETKEDAYLFDAAADLIEQQADRITESESHRNDLADKIVEQKTEIGALKARITALESERDALLAAAGREAVGSREAFESAWNQKNGQENWGHEPTAKGLFEDGWNAAFHAGARPVPEGFRIVPIEPTMEMLIAARNADREYQSRMGLPDYVGVGGYDHYVAMLEVDPIARTAPAAAPEKGDGRDALPADSGRLDFLIEKEAGVWTNGWQWMVVQCAFEDPDLFGVGKTPREAIDAAMANQKQAG